jgi:hypothetical protein
MTVGYITTLVGALTSQVSCSLSRTPTGRNISSHILADAFFSNFDDVYLTGSAREEVKADPPKLVAMNDIVS